MAERAVATVQIDNGRVRVTEWRFAPGNGHRPSPARAGLRRGAPHQRTPERGHGERRDGGGIGDGTRVLPDGGGGARRPQSESFRVRLHRDRDQAGTYRCSVLLGVAADTGARGEGRAAPGCALGEIIPRPIRPRTMGREYRGAPRGASGMRRGARPLPDDASAAAPPGTPSAASLGRGSPFAVPEAGA